ncbi:MAG: hypothetical protein JNK30_00945 [Phenylobacterium sp.]|uniref:hypothetical protein n=1 Tax=Phenylobacterium sp. TaxID=1871053 RepID=UPI001A433646|nr:hypothetical protein [Phenylobacterium sp.]MBL8769921.1 hypothetical protein [Phenylobacterium sp.]
MKPIDYLKALGTAAAVLVLNLALTTALITVYGTLIEPGRPQSHYRDMAPQIGAWSGPAGGAILMFAAGLLLARRRHAARNVMAFMTATVAFYVALDLSLGLATAPAADVLTWSFAVSLGLMAAAGFVGAVVGGRRPARGEA